MSDESIIWEVGSAGYLRAKYGLTAENRPHLRLEPTRVPPPLRHLIPLAEKFGISDDLIRVDLVAKSTTKDLDNLRGAVEEHKDLLESWLAGSDADGPVYSDEYIAFAAMIMAADSI